MNNDDNIEKCLHCGYSWTQWALPIGDYAKCPKCQKPTYNSWLMHWKQTYKKLTIRQFKVLLQQYLDAPLTYWATERIDEDITIEPIELVEQWMKEVFH
jgi:uncharacterized paraquat-inducible protein A